VPDAAGVNGVHAAERGIDHDCGMAAAFFWGFVAASSLIIGGLVALRFRIPSRALGLVMGFGGGVLISAVAYELILEAYVGADGEPAGAIALGLAAGALTFYAGDAVIDGMGGADRKAVEASGEGGSALAIVLGIVLDGIPESVVLGLTLIGGGGVGLAVLAAVFLSNLPEAVAATSGLRAQGWPGGRIMVLWLGVVLVSALAALAGFAAMDAAGASAVAFVQAFAGGAILTMLADTMFPEAYQHGGNQVGLVTTLGFFVAFTISTFE
jgi:zinc transporter, ZIP family